MMGYGGREDLEVVVVILSSFWLIFGASLAHATTPERGGPVGVGLGGGFGVSGLSVKMAGQGSALQLMVGPYGLGRGGDGLGVGLDFLLEQPTFATADVLDLAWNLGLGGSLGVGGDDVLIGVSGVAGLEFNLRPIPIDVVLEYRPGLRLSPAGLDLVNFSGHIRYYF